MEEKLFEVEGEFRQFREPSGLQAELSSSAQEFI